MSGAAPGAASVAGTPAAARDRTGAGDAGPVVGTGAEGAVPFVSVVMAVRDEARHIDGVLDTLLAGTYPADRLEVVVADGGSTDGTAARVAAWAAADPRVRCLDNPAGTAAAGLNRAVAAARGDVIVRMDGHALPAPDYVAACVRALARTGASAVGGRMVGHGETPVGRAAAWVTATPLGAGDARYRLGGAGPVDTVYLGAWPRAVLRAAGGFDEGLARNQDYELCLRLRAMGGVVWLDPAIRSTTVTRGTLGGVWRQYLGYGAGRAATLRRHPRSLRWRQAVPALWVAALALAGAAAPAVPAARAALFGLAGSYGVATAGAGLLAARRIGWRDAGRVPPVVWAMHLAWGLGFWAGLLAPGRGEMPRGPEASGAGRGTPGVGAGRGGPASAGRDADGGAPGQGGVGAAP